MPIYNFINNSDGTVFEEFLTIAEREVFLRKNPHISQVLCAPPIGGEMVLKGLNGTLKPNSEFRGLLQKIKKSNVGSNINSF